MATAKTTRRFEIKQDDDGLISVPADVRRADRNFLEQRLFYLSTAQTGCTMCPADLQELGYDVSVPVTLPFIRIGMYDFFNTSVSVSDKNIIGAGLLKWMNFSISNTESAFEIDLISRLKPLVEKGVNPNIKSSALSRVKSSRYHDNENWLTWEEIDACYPNSWILLTDGEDEQIGPGGEIIWRSETQAPDVSEQNTLLYCNKSQASKSAFIIKIEDYVRYRGFSKPDQAYSVFVEELEARLAPPKINRFYYDPVSKQGKLYVMRKSFASASDIYADTNAVLTQEAIDELFREYGVE